MIIQKSTFLLKIARFASEEFKIHLAIVLVIETISNFQVSSSIIKSTFASSPNSIVGVFKDVILSSGIFSLWNITSKESLPEVIWIICALYLFIHLVLLIILIVLMLLRIENKFGIPKIVTMTCTIHSRVLFYPIHFYFTQIINAKVNEKPNTNSFISNQIIFIFTILFSFSNFLFAGLKEMLFYRITKTKNSYSSKNNTHARLILLHKLITPFIINFSEAGGKGASVIVAIISLLYSLLIMADLYFKLSFYNITLLKYSYALGSMTFSVSIFGLINSFDLNAGFSETLLAICALLIVKTSLMHLNLSFENILSGDLYSPERAIHYPLLLKKYTSNYTGLILKRRTFPKESIYLYNSFDPNLDDANNDKDPIKQRATDQEFYSKIIDKFSSSSIINSKSEVFWLYIARIFIKKLDNASKAIIFIDKVKLLKPSIPIRNSAESVQLSLQTSYFKTFSYSEENLELANYFTFREEFNSLKEAMQTEIECHLEFWHELSQDSVSVKKVVDCSNRMDSIYIRIRNRWKKKATRFTQVYPSSLLMYGLYLDSIRGLPSESMPMIQKFYNHNKSHGFKHKIGILDETSALVIASIEKDKAGIIIDTSNTVETVFGIPKDRLVGGKINTLMPNFFAKHHDWFMQRYTESSITKGIDRNIETFGITKEDFIIELDINLKLFPYLEKGVNIMAYMKQPNLEARTLIIAPNGTITGFTEHLKEDGAEKGINFKGLNLFENCIGFAKINAAFNQIFGENETKTKPQNDTQNLSFNKEKFASEEIQPTKENQITNNFTQNYTQMDTNMDQVYQPLREKAQDYNFIEASNKNFETPANKYAQVNTLAMKPRESNSTNKNLTLPKYHTQIPEEEAEEICNLYKEGGHLLFKKKSPNPDLKNEQHLIQARITPYIISGEVYKVMRISNIEITDEQIKPEDENDFINTKTLTLFAKKDTKFEQLSWKNSSKASQTAGMSNEDIPDERSDDDEEPKKDINISIEKKYSFKKISIPDESGHFNTTTKKKEEDHGKNGKENAIHDVDIRHSLTGKGGSSTKSYSHMDLKLIKTLNDFFGEEKIRFITKVSIYGVYVIMMGIFALAVVNYFFTQKSLTEINNGVTIADTASTRLTSVLRAWQWVILTYTRLIGIRPPSPIADQIKNAVVTESDNMLQLNNKLRSNLNDFGSDEIIRVVLGSKVSLYDPTTQEMLTDGPIDSFTANKLLGLKNQLVGTWNGTDAELLSRSEPMTCINNTANEYLISSEAQIDSILGGLENIIDRNKDLLQLILIIENLALVALGISLLYVARVVIRIYSRTFRALVRLTNKSIEERIFRIKKFQSSLNDNIEAKSFVENLNLYLTFFEDNDEKRLKKSKTKEKTMRFFSKNYKIRSLILFIAKYLAVSFFFILVTSGIFAFLYLESIRSFDKLNAVNDQLSVTNKLSYQSSLVLSSYYFNAMYWDDDSMMIRNEGSMEQMDYNLEVFGNVNQQLLNSLFRGESSSDIIIEEFLQSNLCRYLDDEIKVDCDNATQGSLGLLGFNLKYYTISMNYVNLFKEDTSPANIINLVQSYFEAVITDVQVLDKAYNFLTLHILEGFHEEVDTLSALNLLLSLAAVFLIILTTLVIQIVTLRKLIVLDNCQKKVFRSLTYYVFSQNKSVGFLLKKEFGDEIEGLNRILYGS